jgi:hypothetical protein
MNRVALPFDGRADSPIASAAMPAVNAIRPNSEVMSGLPDISTPSRLLLCS